MTDWYDNPFAERKPAWRREDLSTPEGREKVIAEARELSERLGLTQWGPKGVAAEWEEKVAA